MPSENVASVEYQDLSHKNHNLRLRVAIVLLLLPFLAWVMADGAWLFTLTFASVLSIAAAEYALIFRRQGYRPALPVVVLGVFALAVGRFIWGFDRVVHMLVGLCLLSQLWHLVDYERGATQSGTDFALTAGALILLGVVGPYLISLRLMPDGLWWILVVLPAVWLADGFAYLVGMAIGRHPLSPRLSPKKTWEGYLGGVLGGSLGGLLLTLLWRSGANQTHFFTWVNGLILGTSLGILTPLGDLGISMFKREFKLKDTGNLLPGHGGMLDRLDSWLWAGVLGFYLVSWLCS